MIPMPTLIGKTQILEMCTLPIENGADVGYEVRSDWVEGVSVRKLYSACYE